MNLHIVDIAIILGYFLTVILIGLWVSRRGSKDLDSYFLGGKALPWWMLGISDASGMFDISGTMLMVYWLFVYGVKSIWLPFLWPVFNQIFLMMFLSAWLRRSNVLTGAEWIQTRFGRGVGANLAHLSVVLFALVNVIGMLAYLFKGVGKFAVDFLPWHFDSIRASIGGALPTDFIANYISDENIYAIIILGLTSLYVIKGGMVSVVITEVMQFTILTVTSVVIGIIAISRVSPDMIKNVIPAGWENPFFGWKLGVDWSGIFDKVNDAIRNDGNELFSIIFGMMFFKGILASLGGPMPNYDMQRVLATRSPREASMMNGMVNLALYFPRYMMITGITVLALAFYMPELRGSGTLDLEKLLPDVLTRFVPVGVLGFLLAGLTAALMSNFAATINAAPAYIVNDIYKRFMNPHATAKTYVRLSRFASLGVLLVGIVFGLMTQNIRDVMMWIVGALYSAYVMANVLKWIWWRFNGFGYFWGMVLGIVSAMFVPVIGQYIHDTPQFSMNDIADSAALKTKLTEAAPNDHVSAWIRQQLSPEATKSLSQPAGNASSIVDAPLVADLNQIIESGSIFDAARFEGVKLSDTTQDAMKKEHPSQLDTQRLNHMLLQDAYPQILVDRVGRGINTLYCFPIIFAISTLACLLGTWFSRPEDEDVLKSFYKTVNPWGFWGPIREKVMRENPSFKPNHNFGRDAINVIVGIVWQLCLTALPIYIVLQNWTWVGYVAATLVVTSIFIKFNWYDKLEPAEAAVTSA